VKPSRWMLPAVVVGLCLALSLAWAQPSLDIGPYLQNVSATSTVVMWETTEPVAGSVAYGTTADLPGVVADGAPVAIHELKLANLTPATYYGYRISWPGYEGGMFRFRTFPAPNATRFRIVAYGDSRSNVEVHTRIASLIFAQQPALVINTGDLVTDGTKAEQWKPQFFDPLARVMRSISLFPVLGNHDRNADYYYDHMSLPNNEAWYSFDCGIAHFVVLDSNQPYQEGTPQYQWLEQDLASVKEPNRWLIPVFHAPMYSAHPTRGVNSNRWAWERLFERNAVDLTLNGHDHYYFRTDPIGPVHALTGVVRLPEGGRYGAVHIVTGGGGAPLYPVAEPPYSAFGLSVYHIVVLDFDGPAVSGRTIDIDGNVIDSFTLERGRPAPPDTFCAYETMLWERDAVAGAVPLKASDAGSVEGKGSITTKSPFPMRVAGEVAWRAPEGWTISGTPDRFAADPGAEVKLQFRVKGEWAKDAPLPTATVRLTDADGGLDFRNREFIFSPVRVAPPPEPAP